MLAIGIGAVGSVIMYFGTSLLNSLRLDDVVGAIPVHLFAGVWGTLAVTLSNAGTNFTTQLIGVLSVTIFTFIFSFIVFFLLKQFIGLRISEQAEKLGTDVAEIGVRAYAIRD
jgi:Amt family ammonium transporter